MKKLSCILLIDDDLPTNFYNRKVIEKAGCAEHVEVCNSGEAALEFLKKDFNSGPPPQPELIFLDINMPIMDGWEFLEEYDKLPDHLQGDVVVVMLTTSINPDDEVRANELNIHGFARKPLTEKLLIDLVEKHFSQGN